ncbi:hypothetical protein [Streptomyces sp. NPDC048187]|uniref:hypothetical protein n=1 Tax=Streptomyces sp. NPDC048187 TaxID=3365509 RepID=UPI0037149695
MCAQVPAVLGRIVRLCRRADRRAVRLLLGRQVVTGVPAAGRLTATATAPAPPWSPSSACC